MFDKDNNGNISPKEITQAMKQVDISMTDEEIEEVIETVDKNNDGKISFEGNLMQKRA
jgi:Ca2+-binding EF-hand superfamily protein